MLSRSLVLAAVAAAATTAAAQQPTDFTAWLQQRYPDLSRASAADAIAGAIGQGLLHTTADHLALKRALHALRNHKDTGFAQRPVLLETPPGPSLVAATDNLIAEVEFNDGSEFATPLSTAIVASGDNTVANDLDVYTFFTPGEFVTCEVLPRGATPIVDSGLGIKTVNGQMIAFSEDISGTNYLSRTSVWLPLGTYQLEVNAYDGTGGGGYDVAIQRDAATLTPLVAGPNNATTVVPGTGPQPVWTMNLAADSTVTLQVVSSGTSDLYLTVQLADGRTWFVNDDAVGTGLDPAADLDLPAGNYTVHVSDLMGGTVPYSINYTQTPATLSDPCSGVLTGGIVGSQTRRLYRLVNAAMGDLDLQTAGGSNPIGDTILYLFDANMNYLCEVDDANMANANDYYSRLQIGLPPGLYFVGVRGYNTSAGDYTLTTTCGGAFPPVGTVDYGRTNVPVAGGGRVSLSTITICSGNSVRLDSSGGLGVATLYNFMTANGTSLGVMEFTEDGARLGPTGRARTRPTTGYLPTGTQYLLTWHRFEQASTTMFLDIKPSLNCEAGTLTSHGRAGDVAFLFGDFVPSPGVSLAAFGIDGMFCLPIPGTVTQLVGLAVYPATGRVTWLQCPTQVFGVYLQHGDLYALPQGSVLGSFRDRRRL